MRRLLRISFNYALESIFPLLSWMALSLIIDSRLLNVFSITYPFQFISSLLSNVFSVGANISGIKDKNENAVMSGLLAGSILGFFIFGTATFYVEKYLDFMSMDTMFYRNFTIYSLMQIYLQMVFSFVMNKLYYEGKNELANVYSVLFNVLNFLALVLSACLLGNSIIAVIETLAALSIYVLIVLMREADPFHFRCSLPSFVKHNSVDCTTNIITFFTYLLGFSNAMSYGEEYATALSFSTLITDAQWDSFYAIDTVAKIDISKQRFRYKEHLKNAYRLLVLLLLSILLMYLGMRGSYELDNGILLLFIGVHVLTLALYPLYTTKRYFLQMEYSSKRIALNAVIVYLLRLRISFLNTPYCTILGQLASTLCNFVTINIIFRRHYDLSEDGMPMIKAGLLLGR